MGKALPFSFPPPAMRRCPDASGNWMRPVISSPSDASLPGCVRKLDASSSQRCVAAWMRPGTGCVQSTAMRRCPDASGNWMRPGISSASDASLPGCVRKLDASSYRLSQRCVAARMRPETGCVQLSPLPAMRRCPDASGNWMRPVISSPSDASLPGCVRETGCVQFSSPSDASLPGCVRNLDASS
jgi:hypothetical protein